VRRARRLTALLAWMAVLGTAVWWVWGLELGPAPDPAVRPSAWLEWLTATDPALVVAHMIRLGVLALGSWLTVTAVLALVASLVGHDGLLGVALALSPMGVRRLLRSSAATALSIGLATGGSVAATATVGAGAAAAASGGAVGATATMVLRTDPSSATLAPGTATLRLVNGSAVAAREQDTATLSVVNRSAVAAPEKDMATLRLRPDPPFVQPSSQHSFIEPGAAPADAPSLQSDAPPRPDDAAVASEDSLRVVQPGDCFWSIASDVVSGQLQRPATDAEIVPYFRELVAANESRLVVPGEPNLLFSGQELVLPPTTS